MFSYQCSQLSTSESIIKVFDTAKSLQKEDTTTFVSVVVLDEVGLAEDSPNLPLKALHPLLEDGTAGADRHEEQEESEEEYSDKVCSTYIRIQNRGNLSKCRECEYEPALSSTPLSLYPIFIFSAAHVYIHTSNT